MTATLIIVMPILYVILQWSALARMRRGWHVAALLPAVFMVSALGLMAVGIAAGIELAVAVLMFGLPLATAYLLVLWPLHLALSGK